MANSPARNHDAETSPPVRDLPGPARRVLIIGLDGATFDVLDPMMQQGRMPRLKSFLAEGTSGILRSTIPPITPAAWTTFMTGKSPGTHGILDFERYDVRTNRLTFNSTNCLTQVRTIWQILGDKWFKVGCVGVPMTYPPTPVNGFMISGFGTPDTSCDFTYPADLKDEVLRICPDYGFGSRWRRKTFGGDALFAENLEAIQRSFRHECQLTRHCGDTFGWDVLMVVLKLVDNLQHKTWKYLDPRWSGRHPRRSDMVAQCFAVLDGVFGELVEYAERHDASVFVLSDHGHGSLEGQAQPNWLLKQWDYLKLQPGERGPATKIRRWFARWGGRRKGKFAAGNVSLERDLAVDFSRTRACVMHAGMSGFLYVNLAGRQVTGIVPLAEYEALRDELRQRFLNVTSTDPRGESVRVFQAVHKPEKLYGCSREDRDWLPDLLLVPRDGLAVVRKIRSSAPVRWLPERRIEGTHRAEGIFAARGTRIARNRRVNADIVDAAPTILAMLGLRIPDDMEGQVIDGLFEPPIEYASEAATPVSDHREFEEIYSQEQRRLLTQRLVDLGYLE
jgi:predicted AlkP superfamily phosphohydrolase/phosphomutase